jgi:hypothetical protein
LSIRYLDVQSPEIAEYPVLAEAIAARATLPLVLVGETVKSPAYISFSWIVNEFKALGVID